MANTNNVVKFTAKNLAILEDITVNHAYRKFKKIRTELQLPSVRKFLTLTEVQIYYKLSLEDVNELRKNIEKK